MDAVIFEVSHRLIECILVEIFVENKIYIYNMLSFCTFFLEVVNNLISIDLEEMRGEIIGIFVKNVDWNLF